MRHLKRIAEDRECPSGVIAIAMKYASGSKDKWGHPKNKIRKLTGFYFRTWGEVQTYYEIPSPLTEVLTRAQALFPCEAQDKTDLMLPTRIFIMFPYPTPEENFPVALRRRENDRVVCWCDSHHDHYFETGYPIYSEFFHRIQDQCSPLLSQQGSPDPNLTQHYGWVAHRRFPGGRVDVPCDPETCPYAKDKGKLVCKQEGKLKVRLPWSGNPGGVFQYTTRYWKSINSLYARLKRAERELKHVGGGTLTLQDISGWLSTSSSKDTYTDSDGNTQNTTNQLVTIEYGDWYLKQVKQLMEREQIDVKALLPGEEDPIDIEPEKVIPTTAHQPKSTQTQNPTPSPKKSDPGKKPDGFTLPKFKKLMDTAGRSQEFLKIQQDKAACYRVWYELNESPAKPDPEEDLNDPYLQLEKLIAEHGTDTEKTTYQTAFDADDTNALENLMTTIEERLGKLEADQEEKSA